MTHPAPADLTILYGSQTGNAEYLAFQVSEKAQSVGLTTDLLTLNDALQSNLLTWNRLLVVTSTHDNGHMPDNATAFWEWLGTQSGAPYRGLPYAVLTIGDSMYDDFCKAGHDLDQTIAELGGVRLRECVDHDVDYDMTSGVWVSRFLEAAIAAEPWSPDEEVEISADAAADFAVTPEMWFPAHVREMRVLSGEGSAKRVLHFELALDPGFSYLPGDSIDVMPRNSAALLDEWQTAFPHVETVDIGAETLPFATALREHYELRLPHIGLVNALAELAIESPAAQVARVLMNSGDRDAIDAWLWGRDVLDIVREFSLAGSSIEPILAAMRALQPRSYSIASSPRSNPQALSLMVSAVRYEQDGRAHLGAGTAFLESCAEHGTEFDVRRVPAHEFRLPDSDAPIIMIGPGVGVAPFIGFLSELERRSGTTRSWLFFGDQHRATDFLYEEELRAWLDSGVLTRLSLAFSRDQAEKRYVQHELRAQAAAIAEWVDQGAHVYVCGDKNRMAHDVEEALSQLLDSPERAAAGACSLDDLRTQGRYAKDVY